ncbi:MAG: barstar family protein [Clostridia bacterium]|nr:barstar family protein [Clostridia bacterium]
MRTSVLDFTGCVEKEDFYDRIIDALDLGVGYCGRNFDAIYDFSRTEIIPDRIEIRGADKLSGYLEMICLKRLVSTLEDIKKYYIKRGRVFEYEIID